MVTPLGSALACSQDSLFWTSAVDSGEIRWGGSTKYSWEWQDARGAWNQLSPVDILPDTIYTYEDLKISDVDSHYLGYWGAYIPSLGTDDLELNEYFMDGGSYGNRAHIVSHELGRALGLDHVDGCDHVMDDYQYCTSVTPSSNDECSYDELWN